MPNSQKVLYDRLKDAIFFIRPGLLQCVTDTLGPGWQEQISWAKGDQPNDHPDVFRLLKTAIDKWASDFAPKLDRRSSSKLRTFISTCLEARGATEHYGEPITDEQTLRYLDAMKQVAIAVNAPIDDCNKIAQLHRVQLLSMAEHNLKIVHFNPHLPSDHLNKSQGKSLASESTNLYYDEQLGKIIDFTFENQKAIYLPDSQSLLTLSAASTSDRREITLDATDDRDLETVRKMAEIELSTFCKRLALNTGITGGMKKIYCSICLPNAVTSLGFHPKYSNESYDVDELAEAAGLAKTHLVKMDSFDANLSGIYDSEIDGMSIWELRMYQYLHAVWMIDVNISSKEVPTDLVVRNAMNFSRFAWKARDEGVVPIFGTNFRTGDCNDDEVYARAAKYLKLTFETFRANMVSLAYTIFATTIVRLPEQDNRRSFNQLVEKNSKLIATSVPSDISGVLIIEPNSSQENVRIKSSEVVVSLLEKQLGPWPISRITSNWYE